ncbi:hypothetical protein BKA56DRAFT_607493 [Ilyonectria sp. MPI-CAGE-AT-0026]|nr:hypothetical protein BKA56DRAFT_607493 [Ilyonectria sp. MPI-CAGE-AT-0026]
MATEYLTSTYQPALGLSASSASSGEQDVGSQRHTSTAGSQGQCFLTELRLVPWAEDGSQSTNPNNGCRVRRAGKAMAQYIQRTGGVLSANKMFRSHQPTLRKGQAKGHKLDQVEQPPSPPKARAERPLCQPSKRRQMANGVAVSASSAPVLDIREQVPAWPVLVLRDKSKPTAASSRLNSFGSAFPRPRSAF